MNITLDLSAGQLSKLRNGHGIRISPAMFGKGVEMIIDPMTYNNMVKKLERGKGAVISMSGGEIEQNKMEGTGLFAGSGNKSGKISRIKKARKWRDFSDETLRKGIDTGRYGYEQFKEATNPSAINEIFGYEQDFITDAGSSILSFSSTIAPNVSPDNSVLIICDQVENEFSNLGILYAISPSVGIGSLIVDKPAYPIYSKLRNGNYNHLTFRILSSKTFRPIELIDPEINFIFSIK
jgi:hypothetical protein